MFLICAKFAATAEGFSKLNTGGGKTPVGLLIGQALLHELRQPVLYLCPNSQLVRQTAEKATDSFLSRVAG